MFPFPIAKPQNCDIQTFYGARASGGATKNGRTWNKPVGVSHVYMLLIGGGGDGDGSASGGGAGVITAWYGSAQHVPNSLLIQPSAGNNTDTSVSYLGSSSTPINILIASAGSGPTGATQMSANYFTACGFFNSIAGPNGSTGNTTPSAYSFLSGGAVSTNDVTSQYGYRNANNASIGGDGYFLMQPAIVGVAGSQAFGGGIGCGGGSTTTGQAGVGGPGMVLIASW